MTDRYINPEDLGSTLGQKPTFYPEITMNLMFEKCEFVKNKALKVWILWKMRLWNCEFCQKWDFEIVNFVKNDILKLWNLSKMIVSKCEFLDKLQIFAPVCMKEPTQLWFSRTFFGSLFLIVLSEITRKRESKSIKSLVILIL